MQEYPVQDFSLQVFLLQLQVGFFFSVVGINALEDAEDHEHAGSVDSLTRVICTFCRLGFSFTYNLLV